GKKSFEINKILDPNDVAPTLVAMDMEHLFVVDNGGLRTLTGKEGLRLFGYPDDYSFDIPKKDRCDLLGNTVAVPVIKAVSERLLHTL
ncbi:TPA: DNA cytosine methyltransferase, partial [Neisseria gonorrhoeae]